MKHDFSSFCSVLMTLYHLKFRPVKLGLVQNSNSYVFKSLAKVDKTKYVSTYLTGLKYQNFGNSFPVSAAWNLPAT